jgi:hypothetical protein
MNAFDKYYGMIAQRPHATKAASAICRHLASKYQDNYSIHNSQRRCARLHLIVAIIVPSAFSLGQFIKETWLKPTGESRI